MGLCPKSSLKHCLGVKSRDEMVATLVEFKHAYRVKAPQCEAKTDFSVKAGRWFVGAIFGSRETQDFMYENFTIDCSL